MKKLSLAAQREMLIADLQHALARTQTERDDYKRRLERALATLDRVSQALANQS